MRKKSGLKIYLAAMTFVVVSCTTIDPKIAEKRNQFFEYLNSQINKMTYDEALMNWGEPVSEYEGDEIFIIVWGAEKRGDAIYPIGNALFAFQIEKGWRLQLSFNKKTRKMVSWKYDKW
jgi:hypothetical protein